MLKTRNLFVLKGVECDVASIIGNLHFKGLTELTYSATTLERILREFYNNKSVVCSIIPPGFQGKAIEINVVNSKLISSDSENCINVSAGNIPGQFQTIATLNGCDIGDHKSNSSGLKGAPSTKDCAYCVHMNSDHIGRKSVNHNRSVYESENFIVIPTVGEFIKGYLLIIPKEHLMSLAELSFDLRKEFLEVLNDVSYMLRLTYPVNELLVWENGTGNGGIGKAKDSIVHAHVHVAPSKLTAWKIMELSGFHLTKISYSDLSLYGNHSYLLVKGNGNDDWFINDDPDLYIPRQYVRQLIAEEYHFDGDIWNWRTNPFYNLLFNTVKDIQDALIKNWHSLPDRIKTNTKSFFVF